VSRRYHRVLTSIWDEPWTDDVRLVALYLLSNRHRTTEGIYRLPLSYAAEDLGWPTERLGDALKSLIDDEFVRYDPQAKVVLIRNALKVQKPENPNQIKAAVKAVAELPPTAVLAEFATLVATHCEPFAHALAERYGEPFAQPVANTPSPSPSPAAAARPRPMRGSALAVDNAATSSRRGATAAPGDVPTGAADAVMSRLAKLAASHLVAGPDRVAVVEAMSEYPDRDWRAALDTIAAWARKDKPRNLASMFAHALKEAPPIVVVPRVTLRPADDGERGMWENARIAWQQGCTDTTFEIWLAPLDLAGVDEQGQLVATGDEHIINWVAERHIARLQATLPGLRVVARGLVDRTGSDLELVA
jgi:hypothetical protein